MPRRKKVLVAALADSEATEETYLVDNVDSETEPSPKEDSGERSRNPILDLLVRKIGTYSLLKKNQLMDMFRSVDDLYFQAVQFLTEHTEFLEVILADNLAEVLGGITNGRIVHNLPTDKNKDPVWGSHSDFISQGLETLARRIINPKHQNFTEDLERLRIVGSTTLDALEFYSVMGEVYNNLSSELTLLLLSKADRKEKNKRSEKLRKQMADIARALCTKESDIPIATRYIGGIVEQVREVHNRVFNHHLRLLIKVATSHKTDNDQLLDNFQAGSFGLMRAIRDYVPPFNFIGYASSWIRQAVLGSMRAHSNNIRIPGNVLQEYSTLEKIRHSLPKDVSIEELAEKAEQDPKKVQRIYDLVQLAHTYSLDREVNNSENSNPSKDSGPTTLLEIIPDEKQQLDEREESIDRVTDYLALLNPQQRWVVCLYFGLIDYLPEFKSEPYDKSCKESRIRIESFEKERLRQLLITANLRLLRRRGTVSVIR